MGIFVDVCANKGFSSGAKPRARAGGGQENAAPADLFSNNRTPLLLLLLQTVLGAGCGEGRVESETGAAAEGAAPVIASGGEGVQSQSPPAAEFRRLFLNPSSSDSVRQLLARHLCTRDPAFLAREYGNPASTAVIRAAINRGVAAGDTTVVPLLVLLFQQRGGEERIDFEVALLSFGRRAQKPLAALLGDADRSVVLRALDALGKLEATAEIGAVAELLRHPDSWVRIGAAHALGEIGDTTAVGSLMETLDDTSYSVVNAAMVGLGRLRAARAYDRLIEFTGSDNQHIRKHAAMALGELGDPAAKPVLNKLAVWDEDSGVRFMANRAVKALDEE